MRLMLSMSFKTQLLLISKYNQYIAICIIYFPLMNLKNNIKSKQMQTVRHNPDKDSCYFIYFKDFCHYFFVSCKNKKPKCYFQYAQEENGAGSDSDDDSDVPDELKQDYVDEMTGENTPPKPRYEFPSCEGRKLLCTCLFCRCRFHLKSWVHLTSLVQWDHFTNRLQGRDLPTN